jgi:hypothetical protein
MGGSPFALVVEFKTGRARKQAFETRSIVLAKAGAVPEDLSGMQFQ